LYNEQLFNTHSSNFSPRLYSAKRLMSSSLHNSLQKWCESLPLCFGIHSKNIEVVCKPSTMYDKIMVSILNLIFNKVSGHTFIGKVTIYCYCMHSFHINIHVCFRVILKLLKNELVLPRCTWEMVNLKWLWYV